MLSCCSLVLFYCSSFSDSSPIWNYGLLVMFHFWLCMIGSVCILTIVHPFVQTSSLSIFSIFSGVLRNTIVNSITPKFETMRSWGGTTLKLKPSPFRQLQFSGPTPCSVLPLNTFIDFILAKPLIRYHPLLVSELVPSQKFVLSITPQVLW